MTSATLQRPATAGPAPADGSTVYSASAARRDGSRAGADGLRHRRVSPPPLACTVYAVTLVGLFGISATYHRHHLGRPCGPGRG